MPRFRCPNGEFQFPPKSGVCISKTVKKQQPLPQQPQQPIKSQTRKRCPNGTRKSKTKNILGFFDCIPHKQATAPPMTPPPMAPLMAPPIIKATAPIKLNIIGQGSYGCVFRPYIPCQKKKKLPDGSIQRLVSKFMLTSEAKKEIKEFKLIHKNDLNNKYHLGVPTICQPDYNDPHIVNELKKCKLKGNNPLYNEKSNPKLYSVLTFPYGGLNLDDFCKKKLNTFPQSNVDEFWKKCVLNLFEGLVFFRKTNIIHYDLKPQNILFDSENMNMKYIDFGMMKGRNEFITESMNNSNNSCCIHWSYPFENGFVNSKILNKYDRLPQREKEKFANQLRWKIMDNLSVPQKDKIDIGMYLSNPSSIPIVFEYTLFNKTDEYKYGNDEIISFFTGLDEIILNAKPEDFVTNAKGEQVNLTFIKMTADAIDIYGLGFTLQYVLNEFERRKMISSSFFVRCSLLFYSMYTLNPLDRELDVQKLCDQYKNIIGNINP